MTAEPGTGRRVDAKTVGLFLLPLLALAAVIALFLRLGISQDFGSPPPIENLRVERYTLERGWIHLHVRNTGPEPITISQVIVNDAVWPFEVSPAGSIPRLAAATIDLNYMWSPNEAYSIRLLTTNAIGFGIDIPIALQTPVPAPRTLLGFTLIGIYVGVLPIFLGILWFPALRRMGRRSVTFLMAVTMGLLVFLGVDTLFEAREASLVLPEAFQGVGLIAIGLVSTVLLLESIGRHGRQASGDEREKRMRIALIIALGIGFHNLGEGLAIGAAYNIGEFALGKFLVVGFIIQNITEGLGVVAPLLREKPGARTLLLLGSMAGLPAIPGTWIGGYAPSAVLAVLFLAIGAGAIFQVAYEISKLLRGDSAAQSSPSLIPAGIVTGMLLIWITGLLIK